MLFMLVEGGRRNFSNVDAFLELPVLHRVGHCSSTTLFMELVAPFFAEVRLLMLDLVAIWIVDRILTIRIIIDSGSFDI